MSEESAAIGVGERHAAEVRAVHAWNAVVFRQPLVDEGVVGRQQIEEAAIVAEDARDEERRLGEEGAAQRFVEREQHRIRLHRLDVSQVQPLTREVRHQRVGARVVEHSPHLMLQHRGIAQPRALGEIEELRVGNGAPQEERQPRRELEVADAMRRAARGIALDAKQELGRHEHRLDRGLDAVLEFTRAGPHPRA